MRPPEEGQIPAAMAERLIATLLTDAFPAALRSVLQGLCAFDSLIVTTYRASARPRTLFHDLSELQAAVQTSFYESGPYMLDPFYLACRNNVEPGPWRLSDLAPPGFFRSEYYQTFYRRIRLIDEIGLLVHDDGETWIILSLARGGRSPRFSADDIVGLRSVFAVVSAAVRRHWGSGTADAERQPADTLATRLSDFGAGVLSARETEVVQLILNGSSTPAIAKQLGSAEGTVKVHRRHAYAKLGVASQAELFALATRHLAAPGRR
ncbi:helix-turn-helix transcriptional regulator [Oryzibacter oryziterrae]|uniref:helix-turn-helix transcriptional regulator n=1 Tax=Oryzibacter oryziterrae TaxID=2766474 RepID=UPI001F01C025|nr:LuxR C-terminal-related transcriptional regulator [Oryzibacter oryziterrae]